MNYLQLQWYKVLHWEYWPMKVIYYPIFPAWLFFAIRARSFFFFNAANPSIKNGGMAMESKKEIYDMIPSQHIPKTILVEKKAAITEVLKQIEAKQIDFPLIAKPDIGMKAFGVSKIKDAKELQEYIDGIDHDFLVQELIQYPNEAGIFYVRYPGEEHGRITGIVSKEFLSVIGDGSSTIEALIKKNPRSHFQLKALQKKYGNRLSEVLDKNETFILVPFGSHTRGAKFIDDSAKITEKLYQTIHDICVQVPDFYYGRLDILLSSIEELAEGKNFSIIEINGAGSEPTHIYDPKHSLFFAWKEIIRHWGMLNKISIMNKKKGHKFLSFKDGRAMLRENSKLEEQLKTI
ncbi:D-alanine--D-alanine ligase [Spongiimicrobium salis]|uniref:D-alanine--D-alanine ligase n=1 Tax=Spongiimicrobium salis TaxID=1667022 RepID=UPI00374D362C